MIRDLNLLRIPRSLIFKQGERRIFFPDVVVNMFCYRVRKYVGAYLAVLGGAEAIVIGGGIGENTPFIRERIFKEFDWCGISLDLEKNRKVVDREAPITRPESRLPLWVIPTQEGLMMAKEVVDYITNGG